MNKIWIIARKDISEAFRSRSTYVFIIIMIILTFSYISGYESYVKSLTTQQSIDSYSRSFLNNLAYILPITFSIFVCSIFANYAVIIDKAKRNIESLMATPVSVKQIWMGKTLAVTMPSLIVGIAIAILSYLVITIGFVMPKTGSFIFPDALAIVSAFIIVPLLVFVIVSIVTYIQLVITNPRIANFVFSGIFLLLLFGVNALGALRISISYLPLIFLGVTIIGSGASYILSRSLTKEKIVLSSKV
jgi:ABC-2 type transport system permease protein